MRNSDRRINGYSFSSKPNTKYILLALDGIYDVKNKIKSILGLVPYDAVNIEMQISIINYKSNLAGLDFQTCNLVS